MIDDRKQLTPGQVQTRAASAGRKAAARRRRLDKAAALLHEAGWLLLMPGGADGSTRWTKPGDAR